MLTLNDKLFALHRHYNICELYRSCMKRRCSKPDLFNALKYEENQQKHTLQCQLLELLLKLNLVITE
jgi:hypothetical protein